MRMVDRHYFFQVTCGLIEQTGVIGHGVVYLDMFIVTK